MGSGCSRRVGRRKVQPPSRAGCPCHNCSMRRWPRPCGAGTWWMLRTASCLAPGSRSSRCSRRAAGRSTQRLWSGSISPSASMWPQSGVGLTRYTLCKGEDGLCQQLALYQVYYNFCSPHASLRLPVPQPEPTNGTGSAKRWQPRTPAMATGLTDHVWTLREVLLSRVPPWPQPAGL